MYMSEKRLPGIHEAIEKQFKVDVMTCLEEKLSSWKIRCFLDVRRVEEIL